MRDSVSPDASTLGKCHRSLDAWPGFSWLATRIEAFFATGLLVRWVSAKSTVSGGHQTGHDLVHNFSLAFFKLLYFVLCILLKFTHVVDNDTTVHDVPHTQLPSVPQS